VEARQIQSLSQKDFADILEPLWDSDLELAHEYIKVRCYSDLELFCKIFFPHYCELPFNNFHRDTFEFYKHAKKAIRSVDCAPRGYAKSTVKTLFKPIHDICYGLEKYILFISATKAQATQKLKDVRAEILGNMDLRHVYGVGFESKRPGTEYFEVLTPTGPIFLQTVSAGTEIRGLRFRESRPSKIILDDVEDSEEVNNPELREDLYNWLMEVVSYLGTKDTSIEIVGTVLHRDSLLMKLKRNPAYTTNIYKSVISWSEAQDLWQKWRNIYQNIDDDKRAEKALKFFKRNEKAMLKGTQVLCEEKESYYDLMLEMEEKGKRAFMKEKQNAPLPSDEALFDNIWWYYEDKRNGKPGFVIEKTNAFVPLSDLEAYGALDPATGDGADRKSLDYACIPSGYKQHIGAKQCRLFVHRDFTKKAKPTRYIQAIFEQNDLMGYVKFAVETNLYRGLLLENIARERRKLEKERKKSGVKEWAVKVPFYEIDSREKKTTRIFTLEPKVNNGWICFNRALSLDFMNMVEEFPKADHDDAPDALEMLWSLVNNRYKPSAVNIDLMGSK
jgi:predicted phage terminase large subunit-like protein